MERFPFYLGVALVTFSASWLFLIVVLGFPFVTIYANHVLLATFLTLAGLFSGGLGLILVANMSGKGVGRNTLRTWLIVCTIASVGVGLSIAITFPNPFFVGTGSSATAQVSALLTSCSGDPETCTFTLYNTGTADAKTTSNCSLTFGGTTHIATSTVQTIKAVAPAVLVTCTASAGTTPLGSQVSGFITLTNGAEIMFQAGGQ